jgi:hypothetical protein
MPHFVAPVHTGLLLALLALPSAWGLSKLGSCLNTDSGYSSPMGLPYEPISKCKEGCSAQADCAAFTFKNVNGYTCYFYTCWTASALTACEGAQESPPGTPSSWIPAAKCGGTGFTADCPSTSESWSKSAAGCSTPAPPAGPPPTTAGMAGAQPPPRRGGSHRSVPEGTPAALSYPQAARGTPKGT